MLVQIGAAMAAGLTTSIGPCAVPRYLALSGVLSQGGAANSRRAQTLFYAGVVTAYVALACVGGLLMHLYASAAILQRVLAIAFVAAGVGALVHYRSCGSASERLRFSPAGSYLSGFFSSIAIAPCCAPAVLALVGMLGTGSTLAGSGIAVTAFLTGHLAPTVFVGHGISRVIAHGAAHALADAMRTVGAGLMLALGSYYGLGA